VPLLIAKNTFKITRLFAASMLAMATLFIGHTYHKSYQKALAYESALTLGNMHTFAALLENLPAGRGRTKGSGIQDPFTANVRFEIGKQAKHYNSNIAYEVLFRSIKNDTDGSILISATGINKIHAEASAQLAGIAQNKNSASPTFSNAGGTLLQYTVVLSFPEKPELSATLFAEKDISQIINVTRKALFWQALAWILLIMAAHLIAMRYYKKLAAYESHAQQKLNNREALSVLKNAQVDQLQFILEHCENLILLTDEAGKIEWMNGHATDKNNYLKTELKNFIGRELAEVSHNAAIQEVIHKVVLSKEKATYETKTFGGNNTPFWSSTTVFPILNTQGEVSKLLFMDSDITKLKRAESEIEKLRGIARIETNATIRIEADGTVSYSNEPGKAVLHYWGVKEGEKVSKESVLKTLAKARTTGMEQSINMEIEKRILKIRFMPVKNKDYLHLYGEDITESRMERERRNDRTEALEQYNLNITDSINYARHIQESILPGEDQIRRYFKDAFALSMPKDIVSGDFFWVYELEAQQKYLMALGDCTGHGVPGAMMSIIGHSLLNEIVETRGVKEPDAILQLLNHEIIKTLRQKSRTSATDGMDISLVLVDMHQMQITFAGAYQTVYWMNGRLNVLKGDRKPIGGMQHEPERKYNKQCIRISKGDCIYLLSDGYTDQFGGPHEKKFLSHRLRSLIETSHKYSMQAQSFLFKKAFHNWKGQNDQIDDASIIGIKF
jgi:serine phosphatase RsbU (regulator of sigma subunit)